ncbi:MAG TPA: ATP-binding cassette domain-containing protein [Syntrophorhabdaceae bacterium]|nr:ATP-binding cassette domain-containing protein [Syntrophorhabdaceae bacterium]
MIRFDDIVCEFLEIPSFDFKEGRVYKVIFHSDIEKNEFIDLTLGIKRPKRGRVVLFDRDIFNVDINVYYDTLKKVGVVWENGGVISNLKVWENIALPLWFHYGIRPEKIETRVIEFYKNFDMDAQFLSGYMGRLPGTLSAFDKRIICLIRSILMEPELMIYDDVFTGLKSDRVERIREIAEGFHRANPKRTSIYLASTDESLRDLKADYNIVPDDKGFKIWRS